MVEEETKKIEENLENSNFSKETEEEKREKKEKKGKDIEAIMNIYSSFNNTIVHVTDMSGKTITKVTGGMVTKYDRLKANPTVAMFIAKRVGESLKEQGIRTVHIRIRASTGSTGPGPGAHSIMKSLTKDGFKVINILDTTRFARGGPKKRGGRRGRRV